MNSATNTLDKKKTITYTSMCILLVRRITYALFFISIRLVPGRRFLNQHVHNLICMSFNLNYTSVCKPLFELTCIPLHYFQNGRNVSSKSWGPSDLASRPPCRASETIEPIAVATARTAPLTRPARFVLASKEGDEITPVLLRNISVVRWGQQFVET